MLALGIVWILYGIAGIFGFGHVSKRFRGYVWTNDYIRAQGISFIMLGAAFVALYLVNVFFFIGKQIGVGFEILLLSVFVTPSFAYMTMYEKKYRAMAAKRKGGK